MKTHLKTILVIVCAAALLYCFAANPASAQRDNQTINSIPTLKDTGGSSFSLSDLNNHYTLLVFFSIYSDNTATVLKYFGEMRKRQPFTNKLRIVGVNLDPSPDALDNFLRKNKVPFRVLHDISLELSNRFSVRKPPNVFLIDPSRAVVYSNTGFDPDSLSDIESKVADLMNSGSDKKWASADRPDSFDKMFMEKKLVGANTRFSRFCRVNDALLLYVSEDGSLFQFHTREMVRRLIATDVASADWSPDCSSVVFAQKEKSGIWIKPLDGAAMEIAPVGKLPLWSPRGNFIVFMANDDVWVHHIAMQKRWQISADIKSAQWSSEGTLLMLTDNKGRSWLISPFAHATLVEKLFK
jgi:peroxiredoxin